MKNYKLIAKTYAGLEEVLAAEISKIGGKNIELGFRAVYYEGDISIIYKSNYFLRTAIRILKEIYVFKFKNADQFYLKCKNVDWENHFNLEQSFAINSTTINSPDFTNSMFASMRTKDAIADYFRKKKGARPNVDVSNPEIQINVHIHKNTCTLSMDSSGESLHKRGYRVKQGEAPLNEVLAAGMILTTGWNGNSDFLDPMCGSGTLPIEAALIAQNIPAGRFRKDYSFKNWADFDAELFEKIIKSSKKKDFSHKIYASDISGSNLLNAQTNARRALVFNKIVFQKSDFRDLDLQLENATIIINPPYGERLKVENLQELYSMIGERFKHQFPGNTAWVLSSAFESLKYIGLKPNVKMELFNGPLKCKYNSFKLFSGRRNKG